MAKHALEPLLALRIGLAAKALPDSDIRHLMAVLIDTVGLPLTVSKLDSLRLEDLKRNFRGEFEGIEDADLEQAIGYLHGEEVGTFSEVSSLGAETLSQAHSGTAQGLPQPKPYSDGEMPGSIRVACASNRGERLDGHFGSCARFLVYQVSPEEIRLIDVRSVNDAQSKHDKNTYRSNLIQDCDLVYANSIGGPAAAKVIKARLLPMKQPQETSTREILINLQQRLSGEPPPWLAKLMGVKDKDRIRFQVNASTPAAEIEL